MITSVFLSWSIYVALGMLVLAMVLTAIKVIIGPTLADRVLALDQLVAIAIGFIAVIAIRTGFELYIDVALALALTGFLATAALARYLFIKSGGEEERADEEKDSAP